MYNNLAAVFRKCQEWQFSQDMANAYREFKLFWHHWEYIRNSDMTRWEGTCHMKFATTPLGDINALQFEL